MDDAGVSFDNILDDVEGIIGRLQEHGTLSYGDLQRQLGWSPRLHLIHYIRFFESRAWVNYDRVSDELRLLPNGHKALEDASHWEPAARAAFDEHIEDPQPHSVDEFTDPEHDAYDEGDATSLISAEELDLLDMTGAAEFDDDSPDTSEEIEVPDDLRMTEEADAHHFGHGLDEASSEPEPEPAPPAYQPPNPSPSKSFSSTTSTAQRTHHEDTMTSDSYSATSPYAASATSAAEGLYHRQDEVGSGGIGTVYKGVQTRLGRPIAIKEIRNIFHVFADVQRDDIVRRFVEIVQTQATLDHPNIIQIHDVVYDTDYPYVVMQWAPNGSLRRLIDTEGRPPLNVAMSYFLQILHALNSAHEQHIVHGGLKPENVVLDPAGNAMLTDFGMTQVVERASGSGSNQVYVGVGTVAYLSPEQFHNSNLATVQSDIYSLGIMFYEMLTGKVPGRRSPMPSSFYPDIPRKLDDIFDRMCMDDTEDRYQSVHEILREIYSSQDVLAIMDKRSGVLFLRDPMLHGELGINLDGDGESHDLSNLSYDSPAQQSYTVEGSTSSYSGEAEPEAQAVVLSDELELPEDGDGLSASSSVEEVSDKLDQYSALFDDDDDD